MLRKRWAMASETKVKNIVLNKEIIRKVEGEAGRLGLSFSAFVRLLLSGYFDNRKGTDDDGKPG